VVELLTKVLDLTLYSQQLLPLAVAVVAIKPLLAAQLVVQAAVLLTM
jgi:hypothetical protein